jgi:TRAP-type mannitol/chloroaromatic compound transport system permease small subunit
LSITVSQMDGHFYLASVVFYLALTQTINAPDHVWSSFQYSIK